MLRNDFKVFADEDAVIPYDKFLSQPSPFPSPTAIEFKIKFRIVNIVEAHGKNVKPVGLDLTDVSYRVPCSLWIFKEFGDQESA